MEDDRKIGQFVKKGLEEVSYACVWVRSRKEAQEAVEDTPFDIIILDIGLPDGNGLQLLTEWREQNLPAQVLILSARHEVDDKIAGLNLGADDYLTKPFDFRVLLARMRALLRRAETVRPNLLQVGDLTLNTSDHSAARGGRAIRLTAKEYALLELFVLHPGEILGRERIAQHVWDERFDPFSNLIDVYVNRLRKKLGDGTGGSLIHTRRAEGYILEPGESRA